MNLAYYRKSKFSSEVTNSNLKKAIEAVGLKILSESVLPGISALLYTICNDSWIETILKNDRNLVGLLPCNLLVIEKNNETYVGVGNASIIGGVTANNEVQQLSLRVEETLKKLVNDVTGAGPQKASKVKLYSTTTCPYCVMEKQWLDANKIEHQVVYVDKDQNEAQNMVRNTGQMGVPVTEIQYEDGETEYVVGFDKNKLAVLTRA